MFSEYMDDSMAKNEEEKGNEEKNEEEEGKNNGETPVNTKSETKNVVGNVETGNTSSEDKSEQTIELKSDISSKISGYKSFFDSFPNSFHENTSGLSVRQGLYESFASEIGGITEKKIKGFNRELEDGKHAEVREEGGQIYLKIIQEGKDGKNKELSILLNNFESIKTDKKNDKDTIQPTISINGDESLLNDLGNNNGNKNTPEGGNIINNTLTMEKNPELFKDVFNSVHEKIISKEIQDFHGYVQHANDKTLEVKTDFLLKKGYENEDVNLEGEAYEEYLDFFIDSLVTNIEASDIEPQDLIVYQTLLSLCILLRNSSNNIQDIKKTLGFVEEDNVGKEKTVQGGEDLIEFLPINETDLEHFIACRDLLKNMCMEKLLEEKKLYISDAIEYQSDPRVSEIIRLLNCLTK